MVAAANGHLGGGPHLDHVQRFRETLRDLESWLRNGQIRYRADILDGIEQAPGSIAGLHRGENRSRRQAAVLQPEDRRLVELDAVTLRPLARLDLKTDSTLADWLPPASS